MRDPNYIPRPSRHPNGQGVVRLNGQDYYLGQAGDWPKGRRSPPPSIQAAFQGLVGRWLANGQQLPEEQHSPSVNELILAYSKFAEVYYYREEKENTQLGMIHDALRVVKDLFGRSPPLTSAPRS